MVKAEFDLQVQRLRSVYGNSRYPDERVDMLWAKFQTVPFTDFKRAISKLIASEPHAPLYDKIQMELGQTVIGIRQKMVEEQAEKQDCSTCKNTGRYSTKATDGTSWSWRCRCKLGDIAFPNYPLEKFVNL